MHDRTGASALRADDVDARVARGVFGPAVGGDVLHVEAAALHVVAEKMRARVVRITRRIHCRDSNEIRCQLHDLVRGAIDFRADAIDEGGVHDAVL